MAQRSGFFNALKTATGYDLKYNARDYSDNLAAIISDGVRRSKDNELRVTASGGMGLTISVGRAWIKGCWYVNDAIFTSFSVPTAPVGDRARIDRIVLRLNENIEARKIELVYLTGTTATAPEAPALTRSGGVYDLALADIYVGAAVTEINQSNITDQRPNKDLCGWITAPIGYEDFFENLDAEFMEWWQEKKDKLASSTLYKSYIWKTTIDVPTDTITFNIPQYDPTGVDEVQVYSNGLRLFEDTDYTLTNSIIKFNDSKIAGTDIAVVVMKSVDGEGVKSVVDAVTELQDQMATIKNLGEYIYICNGVDDNVQISNLIADWNTKNNQDANASQFNLSIYGKLGVSAPVSGSGSNVSRYRWFDISVANNKSVVLDFAGCSTINLTCEAYYYIGFYLRNAVIKNMRINATCRKSETAGIELFSVVNSLYCESCQFTISAYANSIISANGTFNSCKGSVTNSRANSYCFSTDSNSLIRINGGEYCAYTGINSNDASVIYSPSLSTSSVVITNGMNCPVIAKDLHYQKNAVLCNAGYGAFNDTITTLTVKANVLQNVRGTYPISKADKL